MVWPSGDTSSEIQVPLVVVKVCVRAALSGRPTAGGPPAPPGPPPWAAAGRAVVVARAASANRRRITGGDRRGGGTKCGRMVGTQHQPEKLPPRDPEGKAGVSS